MMSNSTCPRCQLEISAQRLASPPTVCNHCGFTTTKYIREYLEAGERRTISIFASGMVILSFSFMLLMNWDRHSVEIIPLTLKEWIGATGPADAERLGEICMDLKKWDCVENAYSVAGQQDPTQLPRLGEFQMRREKYQEAARTYFSFFQKGGDDLEASYNYARALAKLGEVDEAVKYFDLVLAAKPDVRQVTVVQNYVKLLMDHQRYEQAKTLIQEIRKQGPESGSFMETEFQQIRDVTTASRE